MDIEIEDAYVTMVRAIGMHVATQDNAITAEPIFMVQQKRRIYGMDEARTDCDHVWSREDDCTAEADAEETERLDKLHAESFLDEIDGWERIGYLDIWEDVQPFFTRVGAETYIAENRHNLKEPRVYVDSAYRNREWQLARRLLAAASGVKR